jgi:Protein of unknown function (DUF3489)
MAPSPKTTSDTDTTTASSQTEVVVPAAEPTTRTARAGSKLAQVVALLETDEGATIAKIMAATGWQKHTVRGALAGSITKKLGRTLTSEKVEGRGRVYTIVRTTA